MQQLAVCAKSILNGSVSDRYSYTCDKLGRLTKASFRRKDAAQMLGFSAADYSTAYSYDLQGNMLTLNRRGAVTSKTFGSVNDIRRGVVIV